MRAGLDLTQRWLRSSSQTTQLQAHVLSNNLNFLSVNNQGTESNTASGIQRQWSHSISINVRVLYICRRVFTEETTCQRGSKEKRAAPLYKTPDIPCKTFIHLHLLGVIILTLQHRKVEEWTPPDEKLQLSCDTEAVSLHFFPAFTLIAAYAIFLSPMIIDQTILHELPPPPPVCNISAQSHWSGRWSEPIVDIFQLMHPSS